MLLGREGRGVLVRVPVQAAASRSPAERERVSSANEQSNMAGSSSGVGLVGMKEAVLKAESRGTSVGSVSTSTNASSPASSHPAPPGGGRARASTHISCPASRTLAICSGNVSSECPGINHVVLISNFSKSLRRRTEPTSPAKRPREMSFALSCPPYEPSQPATASTSIPKLRSAASIEGESWCSMLARVRKRSEKRAGWGRGVAREVARRTCEGRSWTHAQRIRPLSCGMMVLTRLAARRWVCNSNGACWASSPAFISSTAALGNCLALRLSLVPLGQIAPASPH